MFLALRVRMPSGSLEQIPPAAFASRGIPMKRVIPFLLAVGLAMTSATGHATSVVPPTFKELVNGADYVVRAKVKAVAAEVINRNGRDRIYTKVELEVTEVIAGKPPTPLVLTMLGGRVGEKAMTLEGAPEFVVGAEDILFIRDNGKAAYPLYAMMHGQYPLLKEEKGARRTYVNRSNLVPLLSTDEVAQPMAQGTSAERLRRMRDPSQALSPEAFIKAIKNARTPESLR